MRHSGKTIYQTPTGGQGVLRGGLARENLAKSLQEIINPGVLPDLSTPKILTRQPTSQFQLAKLVTWMDRSFVDPDTWSAFFASYESAVKASFEAKSRQRREGLKTTAFAGSDACKGCHAGAYDSWIKSKHANAFAILIEKNKAQDAECVSCHVLGASQDGGFVSQEDSPQFMNVHCENCHGPRKAHAVNPVEKSAVVIDKKNPAKVCVSCHHPPHSPDFDYQKYWNKIRHGHGAGTSQ
jgi:nitrate/TMAO reductase-like tetraheme cytochrome c subunit